MAPSKSQREKNRKEHRPVDKEVRAEFQAVAYQHGTPEQDAAYRAKMLRHKDRHHEKAHKIASGEDTESLATLSRSVTKILAHKYLELFTYDGNHQLTQNKPTESLADLKSTEAGEAELPFLLESLNLGSSQDMYGKALEGSGAQAAGLPL